MPYKILSFNKYPKLDIETILKSRPELQELNSFLSSKSFNYIKNNPTESNQFKVHIEQLQSRIKEIIGPNIIHVYDVKDVNNISIGQLPENHNYTKVSLYETASLSLFVFIPTDDIGITTPHSHHASDSITFLSEDSFEYELPITINQDEKSITILFNEQREKLDDHIVIFSKVQINETKLDEIIYPAIQKGIKDTDYKLIVKI